MTKVNTNIVFSVDKRLVKTAFNRAAKAYDAAAVLQKEVGERMLERLPFLRIDPQHILDVGAGTGRPAVALANRYKNARILALDIADAMLQEARGRAPRLQRWRKRYAWICGDAECLPIADRSVDMVFSNLTLQWCTNLDRAFAEFRRVLRPHGVLMFTSLGPDTLRELRSSWKNVDHYNHVNAFIDMHDVGDALMRAGFATPVMDVEHFTLTYPTVMKLMKDLKTIGAHNVTLGRHKGLTSPAKLKAMSHQYETFRCDGALPATYEVIYGHAWATSDKAAKTAQSPQESHIPLESLRRK